MYHLFSDTAIRYDHSALQSARLKSTAHPVQLVVREKTLLATDDKICGNSRAIAFCLFRLPTMPSPTKH